MSKTAELVTFLRLHNVLINRQPEALALNLSEQESVAIYSITDTLFHEGVEGKDEIIRGIFTGEGEHQGVSCMYHTIELRFAGWLTSRRLSHKGDSRSVLASTSEGARTNN